jgi:hypothetical protein
LIDLENAIVIQWTFIFLSSLNTESVMPIFILISVLFFIPKASLAFLNPPQFIALLPPGANEVLERENQITVLCPPKIPNQEKCRVEKLKPQSWKLNVYQDKSKSSKRLGLIVITATPGKGVTAAYTDTANKTIPLESDTGAGDWGYSSYFEFTLKDVQGEWLQLPKRPFLGPVWINPKSDWPVLEDLDKVSTAIFPRPGKMEIGTVYSAGTLGNIVIIKFEGQTVTFRKENSNDMLCGEEPVKVSPADLKTMTKPISDLYDADGHLIAWTANPRGC